MNICVVCAGYVGLVTGAVFADLGNEVICVDNLSDKVAALQQDLPKRVFVDLAFRDPVPEWIVHARKESASMAAGDHFQWIIVRTNVKERQPKRHAVEAALNAAPVLMRRRLVVSTLDAKAVGHEMHDRARRLRRIVRQPATGALRGREFRCKRETETENYGKE